MLPQRILKYWVATTKHFSQLLSERPRWTLATSQMMERFMAICDNADIMKRIIAVLIALLALSLLMPTMLGKAPLLVGSPKNLTVTNAPNYISDPNYMALYATPSVAAFLNESWIPGMPTNYTQGSMFNPTSIYYSGRPGGGKELPGAIVGFMAENNTTTTPPDIIPIEKYGPIPQFKRHQMN